MIIFSIPGRILSIVSRYSRRRVTRGARFDQTYAGCLIPAASSSMAVVTDFGLSIG